MGLNLLLTGGTGTFGRAFLRAASDSESFERIAVYSRDEHKQFNLRRDLGDPPKLRWLIGDTRDYDRLLFALRSVDVIVHAAALKHVPSGEYNPFEHVKTNVLGAQNVMLAAIEAGVEKVLAVSTDKAVEPINVYGATKMVMERLLIAGNGIGKTRFSCVRYGNVIGSRGSFLETLQDLKAKGAKTYQLRSMESTRFWIDVDDAARFVRSRLLDMKGGEIFVPRLRASTAYDFARGILPDAEPEIVGVPPGEKIHETLISEAESQYVTEGPEHYTIRLREQRMERAPWRYTSDEQARSR